MSSFSTPETSLAAYLIMSGCPLLSISYEEKPSGKRQGFFLFEETPLLNTCLTLFQTGQATVNIVMFEHIKSGLIDKIMGRDR